ncbi:MAG TPA: CorA family divalent cation transporter [Gemmatimonadales bacterium]|nr:CorA family divalent cation transporter [Gemmatimonadales bacterium]
MTIRTVVEKSEPRFTWLDVVDPTREELSELVGDYGLHPLSVNDCLDPEHLPKYEVFENHSFVILRAVDAEAPRTADTVQALTRKLAVFAGPSFVITIHRKDQPWLTALEERALANVPLKLATRTEGIQVHLLTQLFNAALDTYQRPLEEVENTLDRFDTKVFEGEVEDPAEFRADLREIHRLKRQVTLCKRLLWRTVDVTQRMVSNAGKAAALLRDVQENAESYHFYADELLDDANTLLNVQLALASQRTSEVMRVLTVFSVFFLPLTFIVGVYGMNFRYMPELYERWGYPAVVLVMAVVTFAIYRWFRVRGWLRR